MEGIERIKVLASEVKDEAVLKIVEYLLTREDMDNKYLNEEKSLKQMISFIKSEAQKKAKDGMAMIEDKVVYGWSIHYWDESNENLEINTKSIDETTKKKSANTKTVESKKTTSKVWIPEGQLTLFD